MRKTDKFAHRAFPTVFIGYSILQKGYKIFSLHTKDFLVSRDVVFQEEIFPFQHNTCSCSPLFPIVQFTSPFVDSSSLVQYTLSTVVPPASSSITPSALSQPVSSTSSVDIPAIVPLDVP